MVLTFNVLVVNKLINNYTILLGIVPIQIQLLQILLPQNRDQREVVKCYIKEQIKLNNNYNLK